MTVPQLHITTCSCGDVDCEKSAEVYAKMKADARRAALEEAANIAQEQKHKEGGAALRCRQDGAYDDAGFFSGGAAAAERIEDKIRALLAPATPASSAQSADAEALRGLAEHLRRIRELPHAERVKWLVDNGLMQGDAPATPTRQEPCTVCSGSGTLYQMETRYEPGADGRDEVPRDVVTSQRRCPLCTPPWMPARQDEGGGA